jgi:hypothetical protein
VTDILPYKLSFIPYHLLSSYKLFVNGTSPLKAEFYLSVSLIDY